MASTTEKVLATTAAVVVTAASFVTVATGESSPIPSGSDTGQAAASILDAGEAATRRDDE